MNYYKSGEFAKMANVSLRTLRYYDSQGLLKPTKVTASGYRLYTDKDLVKLQKILSLKYLGFSLDEIFALTIHDDKDDLQASLKLQSKLIHQKIEHLQSIQQALLETSKHLEENKEIDWQMILNIIHLSNMEKEIVNQYKNSENLNVRISLHQQYSTNPVTWFDWLMEQYQFKSEDVVLEIGCGNGELWKRDYPDFDTPPVLSDISEGMIEDARENLDHAAFTYQAFDMLSIPYPNHTFDKIIANHVMFYAKDIDQALIEIKRVLKPDGVFYCSTYGHNHMCEITALVKEFDPRISLASTNLYEIFGLENGQAILEKQFNQVEQYHHDDTLKVNEEKPIIDYILSCHGNQNDYIPNHYEDFELFLKKKIQNKPFVITKEAGMFKCQNKED